MQQALIDRKCLLTYYFFSFVLVLAAAFYVIKSLHWSLFGDSTIMHYVNFLINKGYAPYRDITDINLPGCYLIESWAVRLFGAGDLGWRLYDFSLLALLTAAFVVIARPYGWFAGVFAGVLFALIHGSEGSRNAGQREEVMVVLVMLGYASLFSALRTRRAIWMLPFGFFIGLAASLKPTAVPLGLVLLLMAAMGLRKRHRAIATYMGFGSFGLFLSAALTFGFLYSHHAFQGFVAISRRLIPYYASIGNKSFVFLVTGMLPRALVLIFALGFGMALLNRSKLEWESWERWALAVGITFGVTSYIAQRKGFDYHTYPLVAFGLLWSGLEFVKTMRRGGRAYMFSVACIACAIGLILFRRLPQISATDPARTITEALQGDLTRVGGKTLQNQVLCLDMVGNCLSTLQRMNLVENTGFISDYMFLGPIGSPPLPFYRNMLWNDLHTSPPRVIILTNMWLCEPYSFDKLNQWPELANFLATNYVLSVTRNIPSTIMAYRMYIRKDGNFVAASERQAGD